MTRIFCLKDIKKTLCFVLTLLTFMTLVLLPDSFAQFDSPEYVVRVIYFLPNDRQPKPDIDEMLDTQIKEAQRFFADQLEAHGFDRKTFSIETDDAGNAIVHHVSGRHDEAYYQDPSTGGSIGAVDEIAEQFDMSKNIYYIVLDSSSIFIDGRRITGWAYGNGVSGVAFVTAFEKVPTIHELGHAFGLSHDYRPDFKAKRIYTKLNFRERMTTSFCAAEWLDAHRYFNSVQLDVDAPSTIHMFPPQLESPPNVIRLRFEVSDNNGVHQVQLSGSTPLQEGAPGLIACKSVNSSRHSIVEFIFNPIRRESYVALSVIDLYGNLRDNAYLIDLTALVPNPAPVSIPDLNLAAAVRSSLDLNANNPITQLDMISLTRLIAENITQIADLSGLEHAVSVSYLGLNSNRISDLTPLAELTYLSDLHLYGNQISDLTPLAGLTHLDTLVLGSNQISDLTPLAGLTHLWQLHLYGNQISDLTPLAGLTQLWSLVLHSNQISGIAPLTKLTQLVHLSLSNNQISDLTPLAGLTQLGYLHLRNNQISGIAPLTKLTQLVHLDLRGNQISDISPLAGFTNLEELYLAGNPIEDLSPLRTLLANNPNLKIDIEVPPPPTALTFSPSTIADQIFTVGEVVNLPLPIATGGTPPYTYTLAPLPEGLSFDETRRELSGRPTTAETTSATYTATDAASISASLTFTIEVTAGVILDVNGDGQVNVIDLAMVALFYGTEVPVGVSLPADVNTDGVVDILDLTAVAQGIDAADNMVSLKDVETTLLIAAEQAVELEAIAGAPRRVSTLGANVSASIRFTAKNVADALAAVRKDVRFRKSIPAMLETFLARLTEITTTPDTTALLPNYPNPFNPETWIPYHLAKAAKVTLTIYDMQGVAVRQLILGHQPAGVYRSKYRAAYWDGRNESGEPVASGAYFYTLTAGDFTATRKLLIIK